MKLKTGMLLAAVLATLCLVLPPVPPVAIDRLLGLVKEGMTLWAVRTLPFAFTRSSAGISPALIASSR